jgi:hypothetical protein
MYKSKYWTAIELSCDLKFQFFWTESPVKIPWVGFRKQVKMEDRTCLCPTIFQKPVIWIVIEVILAIIIRWQWFLVICLFKFKLLNYGLYTPSWIRSASWLSLILFPSWQLSSCTSTANVKYWTLKYWSSKISKTKLSSQVRRIRKFQP